MFKHFTILLIICGIGCSTTNHYALVATNLTNSNMVATIRVDDQSQDIITVQTGVMAPKSQKILDFKSCSPFIFRATIINIEKASPENWQNIVKEFKPIKEDGVALFLNIRNENTEIGMISVGCSGRTLEESSGRTLEENNEK